MGKLWTGMEHFLSNYIQIFLNYCFSEPLKLWRAISLFFYSSRKIIFLVLFQ